MTCSFVLVVYFKTTMSETEILFGQLVIGPAGSGKTTYCKVISEYLQSQNREVIVVNLDPDNEHVPYSTCLDICELVRLGEVMENEKLGPNGSFLYCIDLLNKNFVWFYNRIVEELNNKKAAIANSSSSRRRPYIIFDCPGQIELYTNYSSFKNIIVNLLNYYKTCDEAVAKVDMRLVTVNIVDSHYANDPSKFISVVLNSLTSMLHIETPFVNILSKIDLIEQYGKTDFGIDFYCELPNLSRLVDRISNDHFMSKYKKLTEAIASIIENYSLVSYTPLNVNNMETISRAMSLIDRANGFFISDMSSNEDVLNYYRSIQADFEASKYNNLL